MRGAGYAGRIILVGEEKHLPYERPPLSKQFLLESVEVASIQCLSQSDAEKFDVELRLGVQATQVDSERRTITLADGNILPYDTLLFSSGGRARKLNVPGSDLPGLYYLRSLDDAQAISEALSSAKRAVIVGGGFIGLELASTARARGLSVTLVEAESELMQRLLPAALGRAFRALAERNGVRVSLATPVTSIEGLGGQVSVITPSERLDADLVLVGVGMEPRTELAEQAGCHVDGGILIDREGRTSVPGIWAAGDCTLHHIAIDGMRVRRESWHNAEHQGTAAGRSIAATPEHNPAEEPAWFWTDQFGMNIQIVGHPGRNDEVVLIGQNGREGAVYRTIDPRSGRLTSVTAFANPQAIREARSELRDQLHSGPGSADTARLNPQTHAGSDGEAKMYVNAPTFESKYLWPGEGLSRVPDWVYTDQLVYQREVERIFHGRTWNYVALEGEIENPGDFIRSNVGPTPVVVSRADDGSIHVFENRCAHRAAEFCRELSGNSREFVCPYHQWTYDLTGALTGVPFRRGVNGKGGMPKDFKISEHGLRRLNVTRHRGVVFASYAEDMEPLAEYLGPEVLAEFEATFDGRKPKVLGYYRHSLPGNWKLYHENLKDPYHATLLHTFLVTFGLLVAGNKSLMLADKSGRHGVMASAKSDAKSLSAENKKEMRAYKEGMTLEDPRFMDFIDEFDSPWSVTMATIWPNLIIQREMNTLGVRQIVPTGPHEFIMKWTMFGFDGDDNEMTRHRLRQGNLMGPAGFLGLEDNEAIKFVQDGMQRVPNGEHLVELDPETPVGTSETLISEAAIRAMYKHWREVMGIEQASQ
jgi:anthranilate 1,2-dioxygenase large subunit